MSSALVTFRLIFVVIFLPLLIKGCTFPSDLTGDWITSSRGTLTFTSTTFTPWTVTSRGTFTFTCLENNGTLYISKSNSFTYLAITWYAYLCFDLNAINANAFYYNLGSGIEPDAGNDKVRIFPDGTTITQDLICDTTNYDIGTYDVMVKDGSSASAASACPTPLLNSWGYSFDTGSGDSCSSGSYLSACTTGSLMFNYTSCNTSVAYSAGGDLSCIYSTTSGSTTYLTLYNNDATTDESTTYRYTCMVMTSSGSNVFMTQYPQRCLVDQNSTVVTSPGAALVLSGPTSCDPTTTTPTTTTTTTIITTTDTPVEEVSSALAVGLGVTFALIVLLIVAGVIVYFLWKKHKGEKVRGDKDVEGVTQVKEVKESDDKDGGEGGDGKTEETIVDRLDGGVDPKPDLLPRETSPPFENGRPTTSGSIHVSVTGDEDDRDSKTIELIQEERPDVSNGYSVVGVHPAIDETESSESEVVPFKTFGPQRAIVPKGAVALSNGTKPRAKVGKRNKLPPVDGKHLPPIVEDATPRGPNTRRGSNASTASGLKKKFPRGTVGIQESNESSDDLPGQPDRRNKGSVKMRQMRSLKVIKKPGQDKPPERKIRTRSFRDNKDPSLDEEDSAPQTNTVKVTRVDIPALNKTETKKPKSPKNKKSDLKLEELDDQQIKSVPQGATLEENPDYPFTAPRKASWLDDAVPAETNEVWGKVSNMWKLGQVWMDKTG